MIDNWKESFLIWLGQNKIKRIDTSVEPVQMRSMDGFQVYRMPSSRSTLKFFDKDNQMILDIVNISGFFEVVSIVFELYKSKHLKPPTSSIIEVDEF